ncbi:unnamed protein product [Prorocentrum cordatum]|uniref:Uncharacterized protein n=1 Tax=Prorocentrum cordatum TaxID=2364126 RepID=A0ABN9TFS9_9DINO|nr:unnamed protein product [Polarella glacialis]
MAAFQNGGEGVDGPVPPLRDLPRQGDEHLGALRHVVLGIAAVTTEGAARQRTGRRSDLMHFRCTRLWMLLELSVTDGGAHQPEFIPMASRGMTLFAPTCGRMHASLVPVPGIEGPTSQGPASAQSTALAPLIEAREVIFF